MTNTPPPSSVSLWDLPKIPERLAAKVAFAGKQVVDVGAGAGGLVRFMRSQGAEVIGIENGEVMISQAREADPENADSYIEAEGQDLPLENESADVVVFSYSLHHVPTESMATALAEASRILRPGGTLAVLEPVAAGPGFEVIRLIDDETEVRAAAQAALDNDLPGDLRQIEEELYDASYSFAGIDDFEQNIVDIDPTRKKAFGSVKAELVKRFEANAEVHEDLYWFAGPILLRLFTKG